ncbi:MAG TPA: hypothetical protein VND92_00125 [Vicinamibacterales bacterium]|nr:hypothetical protein [Vicinamibacterales bacterium]
MTEDDLPLEPSAPATPASRPPAAPAAKPSVEFTPDELAREVRRLRRRRAGFLVANILLYALAIEATVESVWRGSPLRWWLVGALLVYLALTTFNWKMLRPMVRLFASLLYLLGIIVFAVFELGAGSNTGLWVAGLGLDRLMLLVVAVSIGITAWLLLRIRLIRRTSLLLVIVSGLAIYSLIPLGVATYYRLPFDAAVRGEHYWTWPPYWMQGVYVASQGLIPLGLLVAVGLTLWAFVRNRTEAMVVPAISVLILLAAFAAASIELTRAHLPNVSETVYMHYWEKFHPQTDIELPGR